MYIRVCIQSPGDHDFAVPSSKDGSSHGPEPGSVRLTNADFRKIMMTPRTGEAV